MLCVCYHQACSRGKHNSAKNTQAQRYSNIVFLN